MTGTVDASRLSRRRQLRAVGDDPLAAGDALHPSAPLEGLEDPTQTAELVISAGFKELSVDLLRGECAAILLQDLDHRVGVSQLRQRLRRVGTAAQLGQLEA